MGRTNVVLDDQLVETGMKVTGIKTKRALIEYALREVIRLEDQKGVLELKGTVKWEGKFRGCGPVPTERDIRRMRKEAWPDK